MSDKTGNELIAKELIAIDLYKEGDITRQECFRAEMDASLNDDSGPLKLQKNSDYLEYIDFKRNRMDIDNDLD